MFLSSIALIFVWYLFILRLLLLPSFNCYLDFGLLLSCFCYYLSSLLLLILSLAENLLEIASLFFEDRDKATYILPSPDPACENLLNFLLLLLLLCVVISLSGDIANDFQAHKKHSITYFKYCFIHWKQVLGLQAMSLWCEGLVSFGVLSFGYKFQKNCYLGGDI